MNNLPQNWAETTLGELSEYITSGSRDWSKYYANEGALFIRTQDINKNRLTEIDGIARVKLPNTVEGKRTLVKTYDLLVTITGANVGKCAVIKDELPEAYVSQSVALVRLVDKSLAPFLHRQLLAPDPSGENFNTWLEENAYGMGRPVLSLENMRSVPIKLPPQPEQKRIADKLDAALARVDACRDRLDRIPTILKRFRQSVLAAAIGGYLTEYWRAERHLSESWERVRLNQVGESRLGKMLDKNKNIGEETPYIRNINVRWFAIDLNDILSIRVTQDEKEKLALLPGDVLICEGGEPGRCAIWKEANSNFVYQKALHRVRLGNNCIPEWFCYVLKHAADSEQLAEFFTGTTIKHLTGVALNNWEFILPSVDEQNEIVRRVESLFAYADRLEARYNAARTQIEKLTPTLLAKAFRGELVPQDPNDEPASKLLARIAAAQSTDKPKKNAKDFAGQI